MKTKLILSLNFLLLLTSSCGPGNSNKKTERLSLNKTGKTSILLLGATLTNELQDEAKKMGVKIEGQTILRLTGDAEDLSTLDIPVETNLSFIEDAKIQIGPKDEIKPDSYSLYLAKKEFGMEEFLKNYPTADGRGVIAGVVDDGISPQQIGFQKTTTGERKFLSKGTQSSLTTYSLTDTGSDFEVFIKEGKSFSGDLDLNQDGKSTNWKGKVSKDGEQVCLDLNTNDTFEEFECGGNFTKTGFYFSLPQKPMLSLLAEVDLKNSVIQIIQSEFGSDSHGEGVASVLAGHKLGGIEGFDGVAPGAQIVDYDLSQETNKSDEAQYTIGTFLLAFDWMAQNRAEVINVSYSLFFTNVEAQTFMARAINTLVEKHNLIISFSAGNNGPGLGSLNRRLIYPSSVLVAGAHVPKELDERVHGVTGLPEEGRVVYYSSRGPGAGAAGPLMISPLSSLTHSSPDTGYRAFSGTSSASPALAGAATVLLSAIKQEGLKVNATTVVNALRLSGRRIKNEPFISQGYGLPQLSKAFEIYKNLIKGKAYTHILTSVNRGNLDGVGAQGIFIKKSEAEATETFRIQLTGVISPIASADSSVNLLVPIKLQYSNGIKGPNELWISASANRMFVDVDINEILNHQNEGFGEIKIVSQLDQSLIHVIPVTVVDDLRPSPSLKTTLEVSSQEGARFHLNVPEGVKGLRVRAKMISGEQRIISIATYDPDYIRQKQFPFTSDFIIPTPKSGHYQLTILMMGGTERKAQVEFEIEELNLKLNTILTKEEKGKISISNLSKENISGIINLQRIGTIHGTQVFTNKTTPEIVLTLPKKGEYRPALKPTANFDLSYFYSNCATLEKNAEGEFIPLKDSIYKGTDEGEVTLKFRCVPFDFGIEATDNFEWMMSVSSLHKEETLRADLAGRTRKDFPLPKLDKGIYIVNFVNPFAEDEKILLGEIEVQ